jgi:hypothetical protein
MGWELDWTLKKNKGREKRSVQVLVSIKIKLKKKYVLKRKTFLGTINRRQPDWAARTQRLPYRGAITEKSRWWQGHGIGDKDAHLFTWELRPREHSRLVDIYSFLWVLSVLSQTPPQTWNRTTLFHNTLQPNAILLSQAVYFHIVKPYRCQVNETTLNSWRS